MRTAIYVYEPSTLTIRVTDPRDLDAQIFRYNQSATVTAAGVHELKPGIYLIVSFGTIDWTATADASRELSMQVVANDKDTWPDPKAQVIALEPGATIESIRDFFTVAKDVSPENAPVEPAADDVEAPDLDPS